MSNYKFETLQLHVGQEPPPGSVWPTPAISTAV